MLRNLAKQVVTAIALLLMFTPAMLSGFGRLPFLFQMFAHAVALIPGIPGDYLRVAYYAMTLDECSLRCRISFGTFFAQSSVTVAQGVYIGAYCVIGTCRIGERTQIASHVQIFGGGRQHGRDELGRILGADEDNFQSLSIGADCWIGASAIVMADIGSGTTIGAGAVVPRPVPPGVVAVGNPVRVLQRVCHGS